MLSDFAALSDDHTPEAILAFANRYGELGIEDSDREGWPPGEAVSVWLAAITAFDELWRTWQAIREEDEEWLRRRFTVTASAVIYRPKGLNEGVRQPASVVIRREPDPDAWERLRAAPLPELARFFVAKGINQRLRGHVNMAVLPFRGNSVRFFPDSLLAAIYVQFMRVFTGSRGERECARKRCGQPFEVTRPDRKYCSASCRSADSRRRHSR